MAKKFLPGDRVVMIRNYVGGVAGTVISTEISHQSINYWTSKEILMLHVIFDDGSKITAAAGNFFRESEYDPNIPF